MFEAIIFPTASLAVIALILGACLAVASIIFKVEKDDRIPEITEALPGANCGGCGYAGCTDYATAIVEKGEEVNLCAAGGAASCAAIAAIMGIEAKAAEPVKAVVMCRGNCDSVRIKFDYKGIEECSAATLVSGGYTGCSYACLGFGSCASKCTNNAITMENGVAVVNPDLCGGCGACVRACPRNVLKLVPVSAQVFATCSTKDKGAIVRKNCSVGCISCKICEKNCEQSAISVTDGTPVIDYSKCTACGVCADKCPQKCIVIS